MKRQDQLPGSQASPDLRSEREGRHLDRWSLATGGDPRDELPAAVREPLVFAPCDRIARHLPALSSLLRFFGRPARGCDQAGGERRPHPGHGVEQGRQLRMAGQQTGSPRGLGTRQSLGIGAEQTLHRRPSPAERLGDHPAAPHCGLGGIERGIAAAACGRGDPCLEGLCPRRAEPDNRTKGIHGRLARRWIAEEFREEEVGLTVGDAAKPGHQRFHQPRCLKDRRRATTRDRDRPLEFAIAADHVPRCIGGQRCGVGLLRPRETAARIAAQETPVDLGEHGSCRLCIARDGQRLRLKTEQRCPQHRECGPRPLRAASNRRWHAPCACGQMGRGRHPEGLLERARVAIVGGGVGGLLEIAGGRRRLVAVERDAAQHDQPPRGERVIELIADDQTAGEQRLRLIGLPLRPQRRAKRDIDPRLRIMIGWRGPPQQSLRRLVDRRTFAGEVSENHTTTIEGDDQGPHDLLRPDGVVDWRREHAPLLQHFLWVGAAHADRDRAGNACG